MRSAMCRLLCPCSVPSLCAAPACSMVQVQSWLSRCSSPLLAALAAAQLCVMSSVSILLMEAAARSLWGWRCGALHLVSWFCVSALALLLLSSPGCGGIGHMNETWAAGVKWHGFRVRGICLGLPMRERRVYASPQVL